MPNPTDGQGNELKVASRDPSLGGDTLELNNITPDTGRDSVTIIVEYERPQLDPQDLVAETLRMFLLDEVTNTWSLAGTNDHVR